jgi:predicted peptidase
MRKQRPFVPPNVDTRFLEAPGEPDIAYSILVPDAYQPAKAIPLVVAMHFSGNPEGAGRSLLEMLVAQAFDALGAVLIAPDSQGGSWSSAANDRAVNRLIQDIQKQFNIDRGRVAVTGFSMGGTGAWQYGMKYPERVSAIIPIAGTPPDSLSTWKLPVFAVHSKDDEVVPIGPTQRSITELKKRGVPAELLEVSGITHYQTYRYVDPLRQAVPWLRELWR